MYRIIGSDARKRIHVADERGDQALNALSGAPPNSKLQGLGSSIAVVTKQFGRSFSNGAAPLPDET